MTQSTGYQKLPLWRDANNLLAEVERAVREFPRYHKYAIGTDLRRQAMDICRAIARAAQSDSPVQRCAWVERLVFFVEDFKTTVQLAKTVRAFASFAHFQRMAELAVAIGKQSGGWWKRLRSVAVSSPSNGDATA
ncbi:MAG TPA: four helix bundle protein [Kofleriaceae bacterium]|nr:four helix bundle protein [Kofleriaceae bacterium]